MKAKKFWSNKKVLVTAGPTKEYLDPVRFITNESSGKMGYAIAEELNNLGADVVLISGPVQIQHSFPIDKIIHINTAQEMLVESQKLYAKIDTAIFAAAVADYRPKIEEKQKIKKVENEMQITFVKNPDIAYEFGKVKNDKQLSIGFALETNNILENSTSKMTKKNFDFIVMNSPNEIGEGFGFDTNRISILTKMKKIEYFKLKDKKEVAKDIVQFVSQNT